MRTRPMALKLKVHALRGICLTVALVSLWAAFAALGFVISSPFEAMPVEAIDDCAGGAINEDWRHDPKLFPAPPKHLSADSEPLEAVVADRSIVFLKSNAQEESCVQLDVDLASYVLEIRAYPGSPEIKATIGAAGREVVVELPQQASASTGFRRLVPMSEAGDEPVEIAFESSEPPRFWPAVAFRSGVRRIDLAPVSAIEVDLDRATLEGGAVFVDERRRRVQTGDGGRFFYALKVPMPAVPVPKDGWRLPGRIITEIEARSGSVMLNAARGPDGQPWSANAAVNAGEGMRKVELAIPDTSLLTELIIANNQTTDGLASEFDIKAVRIEFESAEPVLIERAPPLSLRWAHVQTVGGLLGAIGLLVALTWVARAVTA